MRLPLLLDSLLDQALVMTDDPLCDDMKDVYFIIKEHSYINQN